MQITTCSDASGRSVTFSDKKFLATSFAGLLPIAHIARSLGLFKDAKEVVCATVPVKCNTLYSPQAMFEQRILALAAGFEGLNDHDQLFAFRPRLALQISPAVLRFVASKTVSTGTPSIGSTRLC